MSNYDVLWSDGECLLHVTNMTLEQAEEIQKEFDFKKCRVDMAIEDEAKE